MKLLTTIGIMLALGTAHAAATPYWVAWEGNDFPENEGWTRGHYGDDGPPAIRSLADGIMTLDGLASIEIVDAYRMFRPLNPGSGEEFVAQWGLCVNEVQGNPNFLYDPGFGITSDDGWHVTLLFGVDEVHDLLHQQDASFDRGVFHAWEFRSADMRSYVLSMDGSIILTGMFVNFGHNFDSRFDWGDLVAGAASHSNWDYLRFGVVPEPGSCLAVLALLCAARPSIQIRRHS